MGIGVGYLAVFQVGLSRSDLRYNYPIDILTIRYDLEEYVLDDLLYVSVYVG